MIVRVEDFDHWRGIARSMIKKGVSPQDVVFRDRNEQPSLFGELELDVEVDLAVEDLEAKRDEGKCDKGNSTRNTDQEGKVTENTTGSPSTSQSVDKQFTVPKSFLALAVEVSYHRDPNRWNTLYRALYRIVYEQPQLLDVSTDDDVYRLRRMEQQVRRDAHKTKAFVRFRRVESDGQEFFIAWHQPDHYVLRKVAPFFSRRFKKMNWSIYTPYESVHWDQSQLQFGPGVPRSEAPKSDELEEFWRTYYAAIFNPARVKVKAMKSEMPVRFWKTLPEADLIPDLLASASGRVEEMIAKQEGFGRSAIDYIDTFERERDSKIETLEQLRQAATRCQACDLHCSATQTVFGEGPRSAKIVLVGEQPGDQEDLTGRPFVGPAGQVLDEVLEAAGIARKDLYLTNVVKHFKFTLTEPAGFENSTAAGDTRMRGKHRLHKRPDANEVRACKPWVHAEWALLEKAMVLVCLGSTAATALIRPGFKISLERGKVMPSSLSRLSIATWHPSAILRTPGAELQQKRKAQMIADLKTAVRLLD